MSESTTAPAAPSPVPALRIDEVLPSFDVNLIEHIVVNANPEATYDALLRADLMAGPVATLLIRARDLPNLLGGRRGQRTDKAPDRMTIKDAAGEKTGWCELRATPRVEWLAGLVGQFWHRDYGIVRVPAEEFAGFDRPGYAKTVAGFSMRPYGRGRTLLSYESRTATTDARARRTFATYWLVLRPFVRQLMRSTLVTVRREAEHGGRRAPVDSFAPLGGASSPP